MVERRKSGREDQTAATLGTWRAERQRAATPMPNVARTITRSLSFFTAATGFSSRFFFFFFKAEIMAVGISVN